METENRKAIIEEIITLELDMFKRVKTIEPSECQQREKAFKAMRQMTHSVLSFETLRSYLNDLKNAQKNDRNLFAEKYARMQNLIPPLNNNPKIRMITDIESSMIKEFYKNHPKMFEGGIHNFEKYLRCELETYSDITISLYLRDAIKAQRQQRNLSKERYETLSYSLNYFP